MNYYARLSKLRFKLSRSQYSTFPTPRKIKKIKEIYQKLFDDMMRSVNTA